MEPGPWIAVAIFVLTQITSVVWLLATMKGDSKIMRREIEAIQVEISKFGNVLERLADFRGQLAVYEERQLAQGKRLDEVAARMSRYVDDQRYTHRCVFSCTQQASLGDGNKC